MKMNLSKSFKKGFTLIELLVVVAIIGILAAVVLSNLNTARTKAKDASVQASMASMRAQAELGVNSAGRYFADVCTSLTVTPPGSLLSMITAINAVASPNAVSCADNGDGGPAAAWGAAVTLPGGGTFCVDSSGYSGIRATAPTTEIASAAGTADDVICIDG